VVLLVDFLLVLADYLWEGRILVVVDLSILVEDRR
jgi:hypothetical protein